MSNCGDDVSLLWSASLLVSIGVAFVPFLVGLRSRQGALGCGGSVALGLIVPLAVALEPFYIGALRSLLDCGSLTRVPVIVGTPPAIIALGASALLIVMRQD
jgi:hypothetical protein